MTDHFSWTVADILAATAPMIDWRVEERPDKYAARLLDPGPEALSVCGIDWIDAQGKCAMKYTRIQSETLDTALLLLCPTASPDLLPVCTAEFEAKADKVVKVLLDVQWLIPDPERKIPEWTAGIAREPAIFAGAGIGQMNKVRNLFLEYLERTIFTFYKPGLPAARSGPDHPAVQACKQQYSRCFPARKLIPAAHRDWFDTFLTYFHSGTTTHTYANR